MFTEVLNLTQFLGGFKFNDEEEEGDFEDGYERNDIYFMHSNDNNYTDKIVTVIDRAKLFIMRFISPSKIFTIPCKGQRCPVLYSFSFRQCFCLFLTTIYYPTMWHITAVLQYHREDQLSDEDIDREFYGEERDNSSSFQSSEIDSEEKIKKREKGKIISISNSPKIVSPEWSLCSSNMFFRFMNMSRFRTYLWFIFHFIYVLYIISSCHLFVIFTISVW